MILISSEIKSLLNSTELTLIYSTVHSNIENIILITQKGLIVLLRFRLFASLMDGKTLTSYHQKICCNL